MFQCCWNETCRIQQWRNWWYINKDSQPDKTFMVKTHYILPLICAKKRYGDGRFGCSYCDLIRGGAINEKWCQ